VFDALTMLRPYKHAWTTDDARREIASLAGTHFDPLVAKAFDACFDKILEIRVTHPDLPERP
jgi:putative two-component system response regulator